MGTARLSGLIWPVGRACVDRSSRAFLLEATWGTQGPLPAGESGPSASPGACGGMEGLALQNQHFTPAQITLLGTWGHDHPAQPTLQMRTSVPRGQVWPKVRSKRLAEGPRAAHGPGTELLKV